MDVTLRAGSPEDAGACGTICYEAFAAISGAHNFPADFPSPEIAIELMTWMLNHPRFHSIVAEQGGRIVGSNFVDGRDAVAGIGPITIDPSVQNRTIGRRLMEAAIRHAETSKFAGVRLVQGAFHGRSLALYAKLGFDVREPLACIQGPALDLSVPGHAVRPATAADIPACSALCRKIHGYDRGGELRDAVAQGSAMLVERGGHITGYATIIAFFGHAVGETNEDIQALIGAAKMFAGPGFLLPTRNAALFRWCLAHGLRIVQPMTLMTRGEYREPSGAYLPSIWY